MEYSFPGRSSPTEWPAFCSIEAIRPAHWESRHSSLQLRRKRRKQMSATYSATTTPVFGSASHATSGAPLVPMEESKPGPFCHGGVAKIVCSLRPSPKEMHHSGSGGLRAVPARGVGIGELYGSRGGIHVQRGSAHRSHIGIRWRDSWHRRTGGFRPCTPDHKLHSRHCW